MPCRELASTTGGAIIGRVAVGGGRRLRWVGVAALVPLLAAIAAIAKTTLASRPAHHAARTSGVGSQVILAGLGSAAAQAAEAWSAAPFSEFELGSQKAVARIVGSGLVLFEYRDRTFGSCLVVLPAQRPAEHWGAGPGPACRNPSHRPVSVATSAGLLWSNVPPGATLVRLRTATYRGWERPLAGAAVFLVTGPNQPTRDPFTLDALDKRGHLLAREQWTRRGVTYSYRDAQGRLTGSAMASQRASEL